MVITVTKTIPASDWYTTTGSVTIALTGVDNIVVNSKKALIKIPISQSKATIAANPSDKGKNYVKDLKKVEDAIKIKGWLVDETGSSAWQQAWQLRSMSSSGGPVTSLIIEDLTFGTGSQQAFLEEVTFIAHPNRTQSLRINETSSASVDIARVEVDLSFYLGDER